MDTHYSKSEKVLDKIKENFLEEHGTILSIGDYLDLKVMLKEKEKNLKNKSIEIIM